MGDVKLCRLCAIEQESFVGIYADEGQKLDLETKINKCLQIELFAQDILPKLVCLDCCSKLNQCFDFFETSSKAQVTLHVIFAETETETKTEKMEEVEVEIEEEYEPGSSVDEEDDENSADAASDGEAPVYVECVLSDSQGASNSKLHLGAAAISKRKCRVPIRFPPSDKTEEDSSDTVKVQTRQARAEAELANEQIETLSSKRNMSATTNRNVDDSSPRKRRDGWEKYPWMCTDCDQELPSMQALRTHHNTVHNQPARFMCAECSKIYNKYYGFVSHVRRHRNYMKFCCEECGKCFSNKKVLESHRATHSDARPFVCSECGKSFRQQSALYVHNRSHQPDSVKNKYPCDQCDKRFSTKPNLVTHKRIHTGIRNFTCDQCGKSFIQKGNLDAHMLTHSHEKPHPCPICNKGFKTPLQLRKHHTVHTGAKPHQCDVCGRQFRERGTLREHHRIHTGAMPFTCEFCGKAFRFKGILTTHRRQHTGERPYSCLECQHHFTNWPNYNKHMKRRHGINTSVQPDPNKIAMAAQQALQAQQQVSTHEVPPASPHQGSVYSEDASREHFYNPPAAPPNMGHYATGPMAGSMLGFYNIPQLQNMQTSTPMDMLHHR